MTCLFWYIWDSDSVPTRMQTHEDEHFPQQLTSPTSWRKSAQSEGFAPPWAPCLQGGASRRLCWDSSWQCEQSLIQFPAPHHTPQSIFPTYAQSHPTSWNSKLSKIIKHQKCNKIEFEGIDWVCSFWMNQNKCVHFFSSIKFMELGKVKKIGSHLPQY